MYGNDDHWFSKRKALEQQVQFCKQFLYLEHTLASFVRVPPIPENLQEELVSYPIFRKLIMMLWSLFPWILVFPPLGTFLYLFLDMLLLCLCTLYRDENFDCLFRFLCYPWRKSVTSGAISTFEPSAREAIAVSRSLPHAPSIQTPRDSYLLEEPREDGEDFVLLSPRDFSDTNVNELALDAQLHFPDHNVTDAIIEHWKKQNTSTFGNNVTPSSTPHAFPLQPHMPRRFGDESLHPEHDSPVVQPRRRLYRSPYFGYIFPDPHLRFYDDGDSLRFDDNDDVRVQAVSPLPSFEEEEKQLEAAAAQDFKCMQEYLHRDYADESPTDDSAPSGSIQSPTDNAVFPIRVPSPISTSESVPIMMHTPASTSSPTILVSEPSSAATLTAAQVHEDGYPINAHVNRNVPPVLEPSTQPAVVHSVTLARDLNLSDWLRKNLQGRSASLSSEEQRLIISIQDKIHQFHVLKEPSQVSVWCNELFRQAKPDILFECLYQVVGAIFSYATTGAPTPSQTFDVGLIRCSHLLLHLCSRFHNGRAAEVCKYLLYHRFPICRPSLDPAPVDVGSAYYSIELMCMVASIEFDAGSKPLTIKDVHRWFIRINKACVGRSQLGAHVSAALCAFMRYFSPTYQQIDEGLMLQARQSMQKLLPCMDSSVYKNDLAALVNGSVKPQPVYVLEAEAKIKSIEWMKQIYVQEKAQKAQPLSFLSSRGRNKVIAQEIRTMFNTVSIDDLRETTASLHVSPDDENARMEMDAKIAKRDRREWMIELANSGPSVARDFGIYVFANEMFQSRSILESMELDQADVGDTVTRHQRDDVSAARALAYLFGYVCRGAPRTRDVIVAKFYEETPFLIPKLNEAVSEHTKKIVWVFAAMCVSDVQLPFTIEDGWRWLKRIVIENPREVFSMILLAFLQIAGERYAQDSQFKARFRLVLESVQVANIRRELELEKNASKDAKRRNQLDTRLTELGRLDKLLTRLLALTLTPTPGSNSHTNSSNRPPRLVSGR